MHVAVLSCVRDRSFDFIFFSFLSHFFKPSILLHLSEKKMSDVSQNILTQGQDPTPVLDSNRLHPLAVPEILSMIGEQIG